MPALRVQILSLQIAQVAGVDEGCSYDLDDPNDRKFLEQLAPEVVEAARAGKLYGSEMSPKVSPENVDVSVK